MTKDSNETKDNSAKWSAPTSSYDDAQRIKKFIVKMKDQKAQIRKDDDKASS